MAVKVFLIVIGYLCAYTFVCSISAPFRYYTMLFFDIRPHNLIGALLAGTLIFSLLAVSIWKTERPAKPTWLDRLHHIDYSLLVYLAGCLTLLAATYLESNARTYLFIILPLLVYAIAVTLLITTLVRIRDKNMRNTLYWPDFFRIYPLKTPLGFMTFLLLAGILLTAIFEIASFFFGARELYFPRLVRFVFFQILTVIVLTGFCTALKTLSRSYEQVNEEKIKAERLKTELITNVSHDIRTPLTSIINYVDLIKKLPLSDTQLAKYTAVLEKKSRRLKMLLSDLIDASKASTGNVTVELQTIDLNELIGQIAGEFDETFAARQLPFIFNSSPEPVTVWADGRHLWRVMENILANAGKYALPGTRVYADITKAAPSVLFSLKNVSQEPLGLPGEELMEQFVRGDRARTSEGSGLGLYIARDLTELMGGSLAILTHGDLFEVVLTLPAAEGAASTTPTTPASLKSRHKS